MAVKTNNKVNGKDYFLITKTVGKKINEKGLEVPIRKYFRGKSRKEAEDKYAEYLEKQAQGIESKKQYFGIVADNWLYEFLLNDNSLAVRTRELYFTTWNKYVKGSKIYHLPMENITASAVQGFYNSLDCPTSALQTIHKVMKRFYKYVEREGIGKNVTGSLVLPHKGEEYKAEDNEIIVWTDEEIKTILNSFDKAQNGFRLKFLIILAYNTGCRISELLAVKYSDFTAEGLNINKQVIEYNEHKRNGEKKKEFKTGKLKSKSSYRVIPLNADVLRELEKHKIWQKEDMLKNGYRTDFLFTTKTGELYDRHNIPHACKRYYNRIGVENKSFHTYRHTFGTNLCRKGITLQTAYKLMGHSDISITAKYYVNVLADEKQRAVDLLAGVIEN